MDKVEIGFDMLTIMSDEELEYRITKVSEEISIRSSKGKKTRREEDDLCYLQREWQIRQSRRDAYYQYLKESQDYDLALQNYENTLPEYKPTPPPAWLVDLLGWY